MRRGGGRLRAVRVALMLAVVALVVGGIAWGGYNGSVLADWTWSLAPHQ